MPRSLPALVLVPLLLNCGASPTAPQRSVTTAPPLTPPAGEAAAPPPSTATGPSTPVARASQAGPLPFFVPSAEQIRSRGATPRLNGRKAAPLKKKWSARVGKTTFRSTIALEQGAIIIGTHGASLDGANEASDGIYVLEPKTGKQLRFIAAPGSADRDVGGVAVDGQTVIFGTDNGKVAKIDWSSGVSAWGTELAGKVRPAPALANLDGRGALDVVLGDEAGDLHALDGDTGVHLWLRSTGVNEYDARGFIAAAAVADLNGDAIDDVIAGARDGALVAYNGRTGDELWREQDGSGIHASPSVLDVDADGRLEVLAAWSYSRLSLLDAQTGVVRYDQRLEQDSIGIEGLFATPVPLPTPQGPGYFVQGTSWWGGHHGAAKPRETVDGIVLVAQTGRAFRTNEGRVTASAVVLDLGDDGVWDAVLGTEDGDLLAISADGSRRVLAKLGGPIEAPAAVTDVDADGSFELLVASNDGLLTCLETGSRTRPLVSRFRGETSANRGELGRVDLRFVTEAR